MAPYELRPTSLSVGHKADGRYVLIWEPDHVPLYARPTPERESKFWTYWGQTNSLTLHCSYLAAVGPQCRAWRACSHPSSSSEPHLWQRSTLHLLFWCLFSGSWSGGRTAQRIQWAEHRCWCWDCTHPPCSEAGKYTVWVCHHSNHSKFLREWETFRCYFFLHFICRLNFGYFTIKP